MNENAFFDLLKKKPTAPFDAVEFFKQASVMRLLNLDLRMKIANVAMEQLPQLPAAKIPVRPAGADALKMPGFSPSKMSTSFAMKDPVQSAANPAANNLRANNESAASIKSQAGNNPTGFNGGPFA